MKGGRTRRERGPSRDYSKGVWRALLGPEPDGGEALVAWRLERNRLAQARWQFQAISLTIVRLEAKRVHTSPVVPLLWTLPAVYTSHPSTWI